MTDPPAAAARRGAGTVFGSRGLDRAAFWALLALLLLLAGRLEVYSRADDLPRPRHGERAP